MKTTNQTITVLFENKINSECSLRMIRGFGVGTDTKILTSKTCVYIQHMALYNMYSTSREAVPIAAIIQQPH